MLTTHFLEHNLTKFLLNFCASLQVYGKQSSQGLFFVLCSVRLFTYREGQGNVVSVYAMKTNGGGEM
jgi:hypothetical protein